MPLFKLNVVEARATGRDEEEAILEAFQGVEDVEFAGYIHCEAISEPEATLDFTKDEVFLINMALTNAPVPPVGRDFYTQIVGQIREKINDAMLQLAVQKVMIERETPRDAIVDPLTPQEQERDDEGEAERNWSA